MFSRFFDKVTYTLLLSTALLTVKPELLLGMKSDEEARPLNHLVKGRPLRVKGTRKLGKTTLADMRDRRRANSVFKEGDGQGTNLLLSQSLIVRSSSERVDPSVDLSRSMIRTSQPEESLLDSREVSGEKKSFIDVQEVQVPGVLAVPPLSQQGGIGLQEAAQRNPSGGAKPVGFLAELKAKQATGAAEKAQPPSTRPRAKTGDAVDPRAALAAALMQGRPAREQDPLSRSIVIQSPVEGDGKNPTVASPPLISSRPVEAAEQVKAPVKRLPPPVPVRPEVAAKKKAEEEARLKAEQDATAKKAEEEARRVEAARKLKEEQDRKAAEEAARVKKLEEDRRAEAARKLQEEQDRKAAEEAARVKKLEDERKAEALRQKAEEDRRAEEARQKKAEEARKEEILRQKAEEERKAEAHQKAEQDRKAAAEAAAKMKAEEEARLKAEQDAAAARKIAEENAAAAKKKAEEEAAARQSVASSPVLPVWNSGFELDDVTAQPRGWSVYAVNPSTGPTVTTVESPGHLKVSGKRNFGIYHGVDLKDFIGETLEFSADMRTTISGFLEAWGRKEVRTMADSKTPGWQRVSIKFPVIAGDTFQKLYIGSLSEGELEVKDLRLIRASESKPVLPTWNSRFELDGGTAQPRSWNVYAVNSSTGPTSITFMEEGYVRISGRRNFGVYTAPLDLSSFVGKKIRFSALIKAPISGFIEFWGKHERDRTNFLPSNEWQSVFVETVIEAGSTSQKLYIGSLGDGAVDVKDLHLEEVPE